MTTQFHRQTGEGAARPDAQKDTGRTPRHDPHNSSINTVHFNSTHQHGRIDADLAGLIALAVVAGWLLTVGGAR